MMGTKSSKRANRYKENAETKMEMHCDVQILGFIISQEQQKKKIPDFA